MDGRGFGPSNQEALRDVLLDTRQRLISVVDKGTLNEALVHPREILRPVIAHSAYSFILVHNHPSGTIPRPALCRI